MKIPKYWAKEIYSINQGPGKTVVGVCWRWSETSLDEARQRAKAGAQQVAQKLADQQKPDRYAYDERPLREEITQVITNNRNQEIGLVTRNAYGALVLNAAQAMFIDIDFKDEAKPAINLFGKGPSQEDKAVREVEQWVQRQPGLSLRIYRTFGGLRCLIINEVFDPTAKSSLEILNSLKSDPLYVRLCQSQSCFRARLTPKHWRCGLSKPPARFPWDNTPDELRYRQWEADYQRASAQYAVCKLIKQIGSQAVHPDVAPILALHDRFTSPASNLALA